MSALLAARSTLAATSPEFAGEPFVIYVEDNGPLGSPFTDRISPLVALPPGDLGLPFMPERFPRVCPSAGSNTYGSFSLATGDVTVSDGLT